MSSSPLPALPDARLAAGAARHQGHFSVETVQQLLTDSYRLLSEHARVHRHLVLLAERLTTERLDALAHVQGAPGKALARVLFVCGHNAGRSQMAAALLTARAGGRVAVSSAGTEPAAEIEPYVARVLLEAGLDLGDACPKPLTSKVVEAADVVHQGLRRHLPGGARPPVPGLARRRPRRRPDRRRTDLRDEIDAHITELLDSLLR